jgi:CheY-like chemotaxis protein
MPDIPAVLPAPAPPAGAEILVVEDDPEVGDVLGAMLDGMGLKATVVRDAAEALTAFTSRPFDLVLTDLGLPGMSGRGLAKEVGARWPGTPVVLVTGWTVDETDRSDGVVEVVIKPVQKDILQDAVGRALAARASAPDQEGTR